MEAKASYEERAEVTLRKSDILACDAFSDPWKYYTVNISQVFAKVKNLLVVYQNIKNI
jgi:hypothetical protein